MTSSNVMTGEVWCLHISLPNRSSDKKNSCREGMKYVVWGGGWYYFLSVPSQVQCQAEVNTYFTASYSIDWLHCLGLRENWKIYQNRDEIRDMQTWHPASKEIRFLNLQQICGVKKKKDTTTGWMFWSGNLTQYLMSPECLMSSDWFKISMAHLWSRNSTTWQYSDFNLLSQLHTSPISAKHSLHFTHISLFTSYVFNLHESC